MALWGNKDSKTASGTVSIASTGVVTGSSTSFTTQARIGDILTANSVDYQIVSITSNTVAKVIMGRNNGNGSVTTCSAQAYTLSEKPAFVSHESRSSSSDSGDSAAVYGVDTAEAAAEASNGTPVIHSGWVRRTTGTGGRAGRTFTEVLVASGSITGDLEDVVMQDLSIVISAQPVNRSVTAPAATTFAVTAATVPTGGTIGYQWQISTDSGANWSNVTNTGVYTGATTATLAISASTGLNGRQYRCNLSATGATTVTTTARTLTVA